MMRTINTGFGVPGTEKCGANNADSGIVGSDIAVNSGLGSGSIPLVVVAAMIGEALMIP